MLAGVLRPLEVKRMPLDQPPPRETRFGSPLELSRVHWRKLAAILFADMVGSSRLMGRDESGTVARLREHLSRRLGPAAARSGGRVIRLTGDGGLVEFGSAVGALRAAIEFQQAMVEANHSQPDEEAILFRI